MHATTHHPLLHRRKVQLGEAFDGEVFLKNCAERQVSSENDALSLLFWGNNNRIVCETACNLESSRSHCILTVNIETRQPGSEAVRRSKLHLVDLAGSESVKKTNAQGLLLQEACNINLSLHYLEQVIVALQKHQDHVPYRNSIMTSLLRDSLGGNCDTSMIATINPHPSHTPEAVSTCRFAQRVAMITNCARVNESVDPQVLIRKLKRDLAQKEQQLEFYRGKEKQDSSVEGPLSESEREYCKEKVDIFLAAGDDAEGQLPLSDPREVWGFFQTLRDYVNDLRNTSGAGVVQETLDVSTKGAGDGGDGAVVQMQQELAAQQSEIQYLQGMLGQRTRKHHPLRLNTNVDKEKAPPPKDSRKKGSRYGFTMDDVTSVYAASNQSGSPRHFVSAQRSPGRPRRRRRASPERSRSVSKSAPSEHGNRPNADMHGNRAPREPRGQAR